MSWTEWGVLAMGLVLGYAVVSMLMSERKVRPPRQADDATGADAQGGAAPASTAPPSPPPAPPVP